MKIHGIHGNRGEGGTATVEFALILPIVLLLVFSIIDLSRYYYIESSMSNVVRIALRQSVTGAYSANPGTNTNYLYLNRKAAALAAASRAMTPMVDLYTGTNCNLQFYNGDYPNTNVPFTTNVNELGGSGAKIKAVFTQRIEFMTPFARMLHPNTVQSNTITVSTIYKTENYTPKAASLVTP